MCLRLCLSWLGRLLRPKMSDGPELGAGILVIGSLFWDTSRQGWRDERLHMAASEAVTAPIRYGRRSRNRRGEAEGLRQRPEDLPLGHLGLDQDLLIAPPGAPLLSNRSPGVFPRQLEVVSSLFGAGNAMEEPPESVAQGAALALDPDRLGDLPHRR